MTDARVVIIDGIDDPRIAEYRDIADHDRLLAQGLFVGEGRLVVERLIDDRVPIRSLLLNRAAFTALEPRLTDLSRETQTFICATEDFEGLTGYPIHRGCLALAERPAPRLLDDVLTRARSLVLLENVGNADNVGGVFRNAAAFGAGAIVLSHGCADPLYRKAIRTSMAATLRVPFSVVPFADLWTAALSRVRVAGFQLVALTLRPDAVDLETWVAGRDGERVALLLGTEGAGLNAESEALADVAVRIPIRSGVDSLNVSVAAGIALYRCFGASTEGVPTPAARSR
jgi:tRNA G18 (ribose-2'-O)-methylase SpoU